MGGWPGVLQLAVILWGLLVGLSATSVAVSVARWLDAWADKQRAEADVAQALCKDTIAEKTWRVR